MENTNEQQVDVDSFACTACGADLKYKPGTTNLTCEYCGAENEIAQIVVDIEELDFHKHLAESGENEEVLTGKFIKCESCGSSATLEPNVSSSNCPYCATPLVVSQARDEQVIQPKSLLPFKLKKEEAKAEFEKWVNKLWFAPNDLKKASLNFDHFKGVYIPYWTYDADTYSNYVGQRGTHYKIGKDRKTRWRNTSGSVHKFFDDILIVGTQSIPKEYIYQLEPWDLENLVPFDKSYLSGFITEKYQIDLGEGFDIAKKIASSQIRQSVRSDIGGDQQRITSLSTNYKDITFKHLLLPVFVCAYLFKGEVYQFLVNGRTGEVQGERPNSRIKIALAFIASLIVIGAISFGIWYLDDVL